MNIKSILVKIYLFTNRCFYSLATCISPTLNNKLRYRKVFKRRLNLKDPQTFHEKLLYLKLKKYNKDPIVIKCADKLQVREYVLSKGAGEILNEIIGVYENVDEICWAKLPNQFVLKWNFGAGMNIVCKDKSQMSEKEVKSKLRKWGKSKYWLSHAEMQYKYIPKRIICEKYLRDDRYDVLPDYKVYCFHGKPRAILVMFDRGKRVKAQFYDENWKHLVNASKYDAPQHAIEKPECLEKMLILAAQLSSDFPFVRCDFYIINNRIYFGELTFTPAAGLYTAETNIDGKSMAEYIDLDVI